MPNSGIYLIRCVPEDRVYVGQSGNIERRIEQHFAKLKCSNHTNPSLQAAFDKYGEDAFECTVAELVDDQKRLLSAEKEWIVKLLRSGKNVFNLSCIPSDQRIANRLRKHVSSKLPESPTLKVDHHLLRMIEFICVERKIGTNEYIDSTFSTIIKLEYKKLLVEATLRDEGIEAARKIESIDWDSIGSYVPKGSGSRKLPQTLGDKSSHSPGVCGQ